MCDTNYSSMSTKITLEWFIFLRFCGYTKVFLQHNIQRIFSHTHKQNYLYTKHMFVL